MNRWFYALAGAVLLTGVTPASAQAPGEKENQYLRVLASDAPPGEKGVACKNLAIYGSAASLPALKPLLADPELSSWARIAVQAIPGQQADAVLREAAAILQGRLLAGMINSIAVRRDAQAVDLLVTHLNNPDAEVRAAAAEGLGRIGGTKPAKVLSGALAKADAQSKTALAQGAIYCAEGFLHNNQLSDAVKLYDQIRNSGANRQKTLEATRGAILARGAKGIPLLLEQLRSPDRTFVNIGLRTARELPGQDTTAALAAELDRAPAELRPLLLLALGDRNDPAALPAITKAARATDTQLRLAAIGILDRNGDPASAPVLLEIAAEGKPEVSTPAFAAVGRMAGGEVDMLLMRRLGTGPDNVKAAAIELAAQRRIEGVMPQVLVAASQDNPTVRNAALTYLAALGGAAELPKLAQVLAATQDAAAQARMETALVAVSGRVGPTAAKSIMSLMQNPSVGVRLSALQAFAAAGGPESMKAIHQATESTDTDLQDEAVRALSTWPNNWPEDATVLEPLLNLARQGTKDSHKVLAARGYLQFLQNSKTLSAADKITKLKSILPCVTREEEKKLALEIAGPEGSKEREEIGKLMK